MPLPSDPVHLDVKVMQLVCTTIVAATSVPSVAHTAELLAPCCTAVARTVPMSNLRATRLPKLRT